ncbi:serine hydrolase [uncultured Kriegella sp.]|uniref:serine hydrolase domain-containing protein n=1 Tax=uncultured Kriegella sp. TaxID=1798910 RepID=UPI0030D95D50|tara:strand:+ start:125431 stop:126531 length:1101 start_codon:yes stop_codon:yes gene_type:complete
MRFKQVLASGMFFIGFLSLGQDTYSYSKPIHLSDGWQTNDLLSGQIDSTKMYAMFNQLRVKPHKVHSVILVRNNAIEMEEYFGGYDLKKQHDLRSATKSIISILIGIALDKEFIESVDDPFLKYIKTYGPKKNKDERKQHITVRQLLTMSTGLDCNDWDKKSAGQEDKVYRKKDWVQYTLDLPQIYDPGESAMYCSMGTVLAAEVVQQASGMPLYAFAEKYLFNALGITNVAWHHTTEGDIIPSAKRLYMTPRDMAKIGELMLNKGKWKSEQIVSETWVAQSTSFQTKLANIDYGMLWWKIPFVVNAKKFTATVATGNGGQYMMIFPDFNAVAIFTGGAYNSQEDKLPFRIVNDVFLPMLIKLNEN